MAGDEIEVSFEHNHAAVLDLNGSFTVRIIDLIRRSRSMDLTMLELQNSREREMDDWAKLFEQADSRFKFLGGSKPEGANLWILEARWEGKGGAA